MIHREKNSIVFALIATAVLVVSSLAFIGAGHDDMWIMLFAGESVGHGSWFLNQNGVAQEISTSVLGSLLAALAAALAPAGSEFTYWKIFAWFAAILAGLLFYHLLYNQHSNDPHRDRLALFWLLILCCFPEWHFWAWGGNESGLLWLFLLLFVYALTRYTEKPDATNASLLITIAFLLPLVRADALWSPIISMFAFMLAQRLSWQRRLFQAFGTFALVILFHLIRYSLTGKFFPNPAYAKSTFSLAALPLGWDYLASFHMKDPLHIFILLAYPLALAGTARLVRSIFSPGVERPGLFEWASVLVITIDLTTLVVGGDWMAYHRFAVRSLPLKIMLMALWTNDMFRKQQQSSRIIALATVSLVVLTAFSTEILHKGKRAYLAGSTIAPVNVQEVKSIDDYFISSNRPAARDRDILQPWIDNDLETIVADAKKNGTLPVKIATNQAGFFPRALRKKFTTDEILFIDMAGLSDHRIGSLPGKRSSLGLVEGTHPQWTETLLTGHGALGALLSACRPDIVYVLRAEPDQRAMMQQAGYQLIYEKLDAKSWGAVIFQSTSRGDGQCAPLGVLKNT